MLSYVVYPRGLTSIRTRAIYNLQCITVSTTISLLLILGTEAQEVTDVCVFENWDHASNSSRGTISTCGRLFGIMSSVGILGRRIDDVGVLFLAGTEP